MVDSDLVVVTLIKVKLTGRSGRAPFLRRLEAKPTQIRATDVHALSGATSTCHSADDVRNCSASFSSLTSLPRRSDLLPSKGLVLTASDATQALMNVYTTPALVNAHEAPSMSLPTSNAGRQSLGTERMSPQAATWHVRCL